MQDPYLPDIRVNARFGVVYMDDSNVSVARSQDGRYRFKVEKREYVEGA